MMVHLMSLKKTGKFQPRLCSRHLSEGLKTSAKRQVGAILNRRHIHKSVEDQNRRAILSVFDYAGMSENQVSHRKEE